MAYKNIKCSLPIFSLVFENSSLKPKCMALLSLGYASLLKYVAENLSFVLSSKLSSHHCDSPSFTSSFPSLCCSCTVRPSSKAAVPASAPPCYIWASGVGNLFLYLWESFYSPHQRKDLALNSQVKISSPLGMRAGGVGRAETSIY